MKNKYGIPESELKEIIERDKRCVYCGIKLIYPYDTKKRKQSATIEHLNHRHDWDSVRSYTKEGRSTTEIIAMCCGACNSSRGAKPLIQWFESDYCEKNGINISSVSDVVSNYIDVYESSI